MRNPHTSKKTSKRSTLTFCWIFGVLSTSINKIRLDAQIKEYIQNYQLHQTQMTNQNNTNTKK